jgi:hypothetical protein
VPSVSILFDIVLYVDDSQNAIQLGCCTSRPTVFRTVAGDDRARAYQKAFRVSRDGTAIIDAGGSEPTTGSKQQGERTALSSYSKSLRVRFLLVATMSSEG